MAGTPAPRPRISTVPVHARDEDFRIVQKDLAAAIISAQEREIAQMRQWRAQWYGQ